VPDLLEAVDLAVEGDDDVFADIGHRLPAALEIDQRKPGVQQTGIVRFPESHIIRTTMQNGLKHRQGAFGIRLGFGGTGDFSSKTAHWRCP
jgi:hypothetical protein